MQKTITITIVGSLLTNLGMIVSSYPNMSATVEQAYGDYVDRYIATCCTTYGLEAYHDFTRSSAL